MNHMLDTMDQKATKAELHDLAKAQVKKIWDQANFHFQAFQGCYVFVI